MSRSENCGNLLIDFSKITESNEPPDDSNQNKFATATTLNDSLSTKRANRILCSSQPLYKLLADSNDVEDSNPFDHFEKKAGLLDDPFETVEIAALILADPVVATPVGEVPEVKMATLISFDSTMSEPLNSIENTPQKHSSATKTISQKSSSSSSSNSCSDSIAFTDIVSYSEENLCAELRRDSGLDDSFDDIWSTIPNLIDSQTEIDFGSDTDSDIAKLNIPMLKISVANSQLEGNAATNPGNSDIKKSIETKTLDRSNIVEKLASIKLKEVSMKPRIPIYNQAVHINNGSQLHENFDNDAITPATLRSPVEAQHQHQNATGNNAESLIKNLQELVDQCDDKRKQIKAKHLLNGLSSILTKPIAIKKGNGSKNCNLNNKNSVRRPLHGKMKTSYGIMKKVVAPRDKHN